MWRPWGKSTVRIHSASSSPSSTFSCSSFKDIQTLCLDEPPQHQHHHHLPSPSPTRKPSVFHRVRLANSLLRTWSTHLHPQPQPPKLPRTLSEADDVPKPEPQSDVSKTEPQPSIHLPGAEQRVVVYYSSLRVVRPTFEACKSVLSILRGFRVQIDERDVSIDSGFITELNRIMGRTGLGLGLPHIFIGGRYVGGAEEVRQLNEVGELKKLLEDLPAVDPSECHVCAGNRFVLVRRV
ncbi:electron carrier [Spatholobus suberectus]|nr:electron carrier [Spatholobus suberectus]